MKAAVCYEFGKPLVIEELTLDPPQAGELRVKLAACAICHSDIHYMEGAWGGQLPAVYGHEAAGIVDEIGPGVDGLKPGDSVVVTLIRSCGRCYYCEQGHLNMCETQFPMDLKGRLHKKDGTPVLQALRTGAFAEEVVVEQSQVVRIPDTLSLTSASLIACGVITGFGAVTNTAKIPSGSSVVVIGTGGVGLNSVQGAVVAGAHRVIAMDISDEKLEAARTFGATHVVNSAKENALVAVRDLTDGRGADYVFITVGNAKVIENSIELLCRGGTAVIVGMTAVGDKSAIETVNLAGDSQRILGSKMGATRLRVDVPKLVDLYEQGRLKLDELITKCYRLEDINEAVAAVNRGEALRNVIVF